MKWKDPRKGFSLGSFAEDMKSETVGTFKGLMVLVIFPAPRFRYFPEGGMTRPI